MFDHVTIRVADRAASERFFETVLTTLGVQDTHRSRTVATWQDFGVAEADDEHGVTRRLHVAFIAPSRAQVDAFWQAGVDAGHPDDGAPGPRPQYAEDYYGAFLRDPDGNSIEAVHRASRRPEGIIDHLWMRADDLAASTVFYRLVAEIAGFRARHLGPDRSTFGGPAGGSFSVVPGPPTENLHMAFPGREATVRRFYDTAVAAGHEGHGEPGERTRYHPGYYAAYVLDPAGNNIEIVDHHRP